MQLLSLYFLKSLYTQPFPSDSLLLSNVRSGTVHHYAFLWSWVGAVLPSVKPGLMQAGSGLWQMATSI